MRYRSKIPNPAHVAPIGLLVQPGQEFDSPEGLFHPDLEPLDDEAKTHVAEIERQNAEHAAAYQRLVTGQAGLPELAPQDIRAALGLEPLPPTPEPTEEERRIRGLAAAAAPEPATSTKPPARRRPTGEE
jgi:hypothetical protein